MRLKSSIPKLVTISCCVPMEKSYLLFGEKATHVTPNLCPQPADHSQKQKKDERISFFMSFETGLLTALKSIILEAEAQGCY